VKRQPIFSAGSKGTISGKRCRVCFAQILLTLVVVSSYGIDTPSGTDPIRQQLTHAPRWENFVERNGRIYRPEKKRPYTGPVALRYGNEGLALGHCLDGMLHGTSTSWYPDGKKRSEHTYSRGLLQGLSTTWYPNGQKMSQGLYRKGKLHGTWITWDPAGKETKRQSYRNGGPGSKE